MLSHVGLAFAQRKPSSAKPTAQGVKTQPKTTPAIAADEATLKAQLDEIMKLAAVERVGRLEEFIKSNPNSPQTVRARELLAGARAALGDEKLRAGDRAGGVEMFRAVVADAPSSMSDKFFVEIVAQLPANLYMMGERTAALELARAVEAHAAGSAPRLLHVASFYLGVEQPDDAARVAQAAIALRPDLAAAHRALGTAYRYALRLDDAASEFSRALDLDPTSASTRRSLAELKRATGKPEDALALYREQLAADAQDAVARSGVVLALFDAGKREDAERELQSALTGEAKDLPLLVGASYWHAAHGDGARALELAEKAVALEPRFGWAWARIAQGRALLALGRPLEAERALRAARKFGNFPTLDYELAAALAAAGLYDEAAESLSRSFTVRDGQVETRLAGRIESKASDFGELLAPERRASLSQFAGASSAAEGRMLKALLAFHQALKIEGADERVVTESAREFGAGEDEMRAYRNLYAASRLERRGAAQGAALERAEAAIAGVESALAVPHAPVAIFADTDELRQLRQQVVEQDAPLNLLNVQRDVLSKVMRGRIEALAGWALFNQGQTAEAAVRLRRAVSVLPENSEWWRTAEWRLGAALEANGGGRDALAAYVNSYRAQPDPTRRVVIESLYKRLNNGSLKGLDALLATPTATAATRAPMQTDAPTAEPQTPIAETATKTTGPTTTPTPAAIIEPTPAPAIVEPTPTTTPAPTPESATPTPEPSPKTEATPTPETTPTPTPSPEATTPAQSPTPEPSPTPSPEPKTEQKMPESKNETKTPDGVCALTASEMSLTIQNGGGSATVTLNLSNYAGAAPPRINPSTPNWADIVILAEPRAASDTSGSSRFTITSTSRNTGAFIVTFASPCGKQEVTVNVK